MGTRKAWTRIYLRIKTYICRIPEGHFDFLGYTFGRCYSPKTGRAYLGTRPSKKSIKRLMDSIREQTDSSNSLLAADVFVEHLNRKLRGWAAYFKLGPVSTAYAAVDAYTASRLRRWLCHKHKVPGRGLKRYPSEYLYQGLGLVELSPLTRNFPWAKA